MSRTERKAARNEEIRKVELLISEIDYLRSKYPRVAGSAKEYVFREKLPSQKICEWLAVDVFSVALVVFLLWCRSVPGGGSAIGLAFAVVIIGLASIMVALNFREWLELRRHHLCAVSYHERDIQELEECVMPLRQYAKRSLLMRFKGLETRVILNLGGELMLDEENERVQFKYGNHVEELKFTEKDYTVLNERVNKMIQGQMMLELILLIRNCEEGID